MDKNRKMDVEKDETDILVHRLPSLVMRPVHRNYGLWVFRSGRGGCSPGHPLSWFRENPRRFEFFGISHMTAGKGIFWRPDAPVEEIHPGQCVVVTPGTIHHYGGVDGASYTEDTVNFTGELAVMMQRSGLIRDGVYDLGLSHRLLTVIELALEPSDHSQINANFALQKLLMELYNRRAAQTHLERYPQVNELVAQIRENPEKWWSITGMAEYCNMSDDQFRRVFMNRYGVLPKLYIDKLRLNKAAELLVETNLNIAEIAEMMGYQDPFHFSRRFKAVIGFSPQQYRREFVKV